MTNLLLKCLAPLAPLGMLSLALLACSPAATQEATYTAALLRCVDKSTTLGESKACRAKVDADFGVKDGGAQ